MIRIPLCNGAFAIVDEEDADLAEVRWIPHPGKKTCYARRSVRLGGRRVITYLHRAVAQRLGDVEGMVVDHMNGDGLDNRRSNLRICDHATNNRNVAGARRHSGSGQIGVRANKNGRYWMAYICEGRKYIHLGRFERQEDAVAARLAAEAARYGIQPRRAEAHGC